MTKKKICLSCSVGGHLTQMRQLEKLYKEYEYFFITEDSPVTRNLSQKEKMYLVPLANRRKLGVLYNLLVNAFLTLRILLREKPEIIISTGALSTIPCCIIGKMMGRRIIFIESFAKRDTPTLTGKFVYKLADFFIVQWEEMLKFYPKAMNGGSLY